MCSTYLCDIFFFYNSASWNTLLADFDNAYGNVLRPHRNAGNTKNDQYRYYRRYVTVTERTIVCFRYSNSGKKNYNRYSTDY